MKGQPNLTIPKFWQCPPYETPEPGFPIKILGSHRNFQNKKSRIEQLLVEDKGHIEYMLPKFNCEVNPIECVWAQEKRCSKAYCRYGVNPPAEHCTPCSRFDDSRKYASTLQKVRHYMYAYLEGVPGGSDLDKLVKNYKKIIKSHRRISELQ